ncbi:MAG: alpha/beta fold hydrolase [Betaproteobacteria bacterium]
MKHPPLAAWHVDTPHQAYAMGNLQLETGEQIVDFSQSFVTHGTLNSDRSNAILVCASLSGTHHRLDFLIGPGKALDTQKWFIIGTDAIGNGLSTSPSNSVAQPRMRFPHYALRDMVTAQYRLLTEHLRINHLHAVIGASMGGMQALQWAVRHPQFADAIVAMTPMAKTTPWSVLVTSTARACLMADPAWTGDGFDASPERGWRAYAGLMNALVMRTPDAMEFLAGTVEAHRWFEGLVTQQHAVGLDPHDYLYQSLAYERHDVGTTTGFGGDTDAALRSIKARALLLAPPLDLLNPAPAAREAAQCIPGARFVEIPSLQGHAAAANAKPEDSVFLDKVVGEFLRGKCC